MERVQERAYAKINLALDVLGKRTDQYHDVDMVMATVDVYDDVVFAPRDAPDVVVSVTGAELPEENTVVQAARMLRQTFGVDDGAHIHVHKRIPIAAGLAGGSADAAAVLRGLCRLWRLDVSMDRLCALAEHIGADVPFCVRGGCARATGRGERLELLPMPPLCTIVLCTPPVHVSTAAVYKRWQAGEYVRSAGRVADAVRCQDYRTLCRVVGNALMPIAAHMHPVIFDVCDRMRALGADAVCMSGSGPSVYAFVHPDNAHSVAQEMRGGTCDVRVCTWMSAWSA